MSKKYIIIPDTHNKIEIADKILNSIEYDKAIFLGDLFDNFGDSVYEIRKTALWLKNNLHNPKYVFLLGNHDQSYRFFFNPFHYCSGYSDAKSHAINEILTSDDWKLFKYYHVEYGILEGKDVLFTHAGYSYPLFKKFCAKYHIKNKYNESNILKVIQSLDAEIKYGELDKGKSSLLLAAGWSRGGMVKYGGITWNDSDIDMVPIPSVMQIFGHSPHPEPDVIYTYKKDQNSVKRQQYDLFHLNYNDPSLLSVNFNLDTHLHHYGIIEDGKLTIHETGR